MLATVASQLLTELLESSQRGAIFASPHFHGGDSILIFRQSRVSL